MENTINILLILLFLAACDNIETEDSDVDDSQVSEEFIETEDTINLTEVDRIKLIEEFEMKRDHTDAQIAELEKRLQSLEEQEKIALEEILQMIQGQQERIKEQITSIKTVTANRFLDAKYEIDTSMINIEEAIEAAEEEFGGADK